MSRPPSAPAAPSPLRLLFPWIVLVAVLVAGIALCFLLGPSITPFFPGTGAA